MTSERPLALDVSGLNAHYGRSHVLHGVDLAVAQGAVIGLVGRNGVGKTTFVNTVMNIVPATGGSVRVFGEQVTGLSTHKLARMGVRVVPQGRRLFQSVTVREHLAIAMHGTSGRRPLSWAYERFPALQERSASLARTLSGGEQSQLAIARAVMAEPKLILMDEPTEGLAPLTVAEVGRLIDFLRGDGVTVLLIEQNLRFALEHCDELAVMSRGQITHREEVSQITDRAEFVSKFMGVDVSAEVASPSRE